MGNASAPPAGKKMPNNRMSLTTTLVTMFDENEENDKKLLWWWRWWSSCTSAHCVLGNPASHLPPHFKINTFAYTKYYCCKTTAKQRLGWLRRAAHKCPPSIVLMIFIYTTQSSVVTLLLVIVDKCIAIPLCVSSSIISILGMLFSISALFRTNVLRDVLRKTPFAFLAYIEHFRFVASSSSLWLVALSRPLSSHKFPVFYIERERESERVSLPSCVRRSVLVFQFQDNGILHIQNKPLYLFWAGGRGSGIRFEA